MHLIAGRNVAYWIADDAARDISAMRTIPGEAGAIMLVRAMREMGATSMQFTFSGFEITVAARPTAPDGKGDAE
jgi:hypothetical protein